MEDKAIQCLSNVEDSLEKVDVALDDLEAGGSLASFVNILRHALEDLEAAADDLETVKDVDLFSDDDGEDEETASSAGALSRLKRKSLSTTHTTTNDRTDWENLSRAASTATSVTSSILNNSPPDTTIQATPAVATQAALPSTTSVPTTSSTSASTSSSSNLENGTKEVTPQGRSLVPLNSTSTLCNVNQSKLIKSAIKHAAPIQAHFQSSSSSLNGARNVTFQKACVAPPPAALSSGPTQ